MTRSSKDTNPRGGENQSVVSMLTGGSITIPTGERPTLLTLLSYLTILHLIYLIWRETSEGESD